METKYTWKIVDRVRETPMVHTLCLEAVSERPSFIAGQYVTVLLEGYQPVEGKAYSISSAPHEPYVTITIKEMGTFSKALLNVAVGDTITTSAPYGFFYPESDDQCELVFIAGGIGVTPCISIIKDLAHTHDQRPCVLHYSNQTKAESTFDAALQTLAATHESFSLYQYITREHAMAPYIQGRMEASVIMDTVASSQTAMYFLCGSMYFTREIYQALIDAGVTPEHIYTEGFF